MEAIILQAAVGRLKLTERAVASLHDAGADPLEFQTHWIDFLVQWKGTYTKVQQAAKSSPQEIQWFGSVTRERKADPLLRYLFEARNDEEHNGLTPSARHVPGGFQMRATANISSLRLAIGSDGVPKVLDKDGNEIAEIVKSVPAESYLNEVTEYDGKKKVPPPTAHLGETIEPKPLIAADLGLRWLQALIATAQALHRP